jgi:hypothetical protein
MREAELDKNGSERISGLTGVSKISPLSRSISLIKGQGIIEI